VNGDKVVLSTFRIELRGTQITSHNADDGWIDFDSTQACSLQCPVFPAESNAAGIMQVIGSPIQFAARAMQDLSPLPPRFLGTAMAASAILQQV